jgi:hypothetical protein
MSGSAIGDRMRDLLVNLYPERWRARYGEEYRALLEQLSLTPRLLVDIVMAATAAHLDPKWEPARPAVLRRLRAEELVVLMAWLALVVAGSGFQKLTEDPAFAAAASTDPLVGLAMVLVVGGAMVSLVAVLAGASPIVLAIIRSAFVGRRPGTILLLATPLVLLGGWVLATLLLVAAVPAPATTLSRAALLAAWAGSFVIAITLGAAAVAAAAIRSSVPLACYRLAVVPAGVTATAMAVVCVGVGLWGAALAVRAPTLFWSDGGLVATATAASWAGILAMATMATGVAGRSAVRLRRGVGQER